ncbi:hypothetical protein ACI3PL_30900, partial [Lacticaseibacillus paracasei]
LTKLNTITKIGYAFEFGLYKKVIATTNKSLDLPMVIDEVEELLQKSMIEKDVRDNSNRLSLDEQIQRTGGFVVGFKDAY